MAQTSEILIIGGGVIGLSIARALRKAGVRDIAIVERGTLGCEASSAAAGILAPQAEADSADILFEFCRESREMYPEFASQLRDETGVDIELDQTGTLYLAFNDHDREELADRFRWQTEAGLVVDKLSAKEIAEFEPNVSPLAESGLFFRNDWQVENRRLLEALRKFAELNDIAIFENSGVDDLIVENNSVAGAISGNRHFLAGSTILTTGAWTSLIRIGAGSVPVAVRPIKGQVICYRPERPMFRSVIYSPRGYVVPRADGRVLAGSTVEDVGFDKDVTDLGLESLRVAATEIVPDLSRSEIFEQWAGLRPFTANGLPMIGRVAELDGLFVATGHYRNGILLAPATARDVVDEIVRGRTSRYLDAFRVNRAEGSNQAVRK